jgi:hypothetical protein
VKGNWTGNYAEVGAKIYDAWQQLHAAGKSDLTKARVFEILPRARAKLAGSASAQCAL